MCPVFGVQFIALANRIHLCNSKLVFRNIINDDQRIRVNTRDLAVPQIFDLIHNFVANR